MIRKDFSGLYGLLREPWRANEGHLLQKLTSQLTEPPLTPPSPHSELSSFPQTCHAVFFHASMHLSTLLLGTPDPSLFPSLPTHSSGVSPSVTLLGCHWASQAELLGDLRKHPENPTIEIAAFKSLVC